MTGKKFTFKKKASTGKTTANVSTRPVSNCIEDSVNSLDSDFEDFQFLLSSKHADGSEGAGESNDDLATEAAALSASGSWSLSSSQSDVENVPIVSASSRQVVSRVSEGESRSIENNSNDLVIIEEKVTTKITSDAWTGLRQRVNEEKKEEAKNAWKGLMGTMQKNQAVAVMSSKVSAKRQLNGRSNEKQLKQSKKLKVETVSIISSSCSGKLQLKADKLEVVEILDEVPVGNGTASFKMESSETSKTSNSPPKPICPIFLACKRSSSQEKEDEDDGVKPWDMMRTGNPWHCNAESVLETPIEITLNLQSTEAPSISDMDVKAAKKKCPFYKIMPETRFCVDAFDYGVIPDVDVYLLSHFHADHYGGLTKKFRKTIICSKPTGNLVRMKLGVAEECIRRLDLNRKYTLQGVEIVLIDANHCPGSVMFILRLPNGRIYLHTGDFRYTPEMLANRFIQQLRIDCLYLDTTYCDPQYSFPRQSESIEHAISVIKKHLAYRPKTLIVCGTYCIGKERVFAAIADSLGAKVYCDANKFRVIKATENEYFINLLDRNEALCQVHVVPMMKLNPKALLEYLQPRTSTYTNILAVKPTGWEFSRGPGCSTTGSKLKSHHNDCVHILGIPYSEHSSFTELREFVTTTKPRKIQPTVNVGNPKKRTAMMGIIDSWMQSA